MSGKKSARTIDHGFFEERLSAYLDGELTPREHESVEHHLETCPACQWELETLRQTIQWTRELPTLTVPRVFTVPAPAEPVRSARWRWNFLPVLQGATALIAVLLVFAVAGDLILGSLGGSQSPDMAYQEVASSDVEATQLVEKAVEEPAAAEARLEVETILETVVVESEMVVTQTEAPMALSVSPTESPAESPAESMAVGEGVAPAASPRAPAAAAAWESTAEVAEEDGEPPVDAVSPEPEQAISAAEEAVAGGGEPALTVPAPSPLPTVPAPTEGAVATELAMAPATGRDEAVTEPPSAPDVNWLRVIEVLLGAALFLLVFVTVFLTIERRKAQ